MKKTDDRNRWEIAPINDKDVVWSFIVESLNAEHKIIENPKYAHVAMYGSDGFMAIAQTQGVSMLLIEGESELAVRELASAIADPINEEKGNEDLYAEVGEPYYYDESADCNFRCFGWFCIIQFWHTEFHD